MSRARLGVVTFATVAFGLALISRGQVNVWLTTGAAAAVAGALAMLVGRAELPMRFPTGPRHWLTGIVGGLAMAGLTWLVYPLVAGASPDFAEEVALPYAALRDPPGPLLALPLLLMVVAAEELVWRGLLYDELRGRTRPAMAVVACIVLYAVPHAVSGSWVLVVLALGCGTVWTLQRHLTGGLLAPLLTHVVWDVLVFVAFPVGG